MFIDTWRGKRIHHNPLNSPSMDKEAGNAFRVLEQTPS